MQEKGSKELADNLVFAGLFGLIDPPRKEVPAAIRQCRDAGIEVVMVTGDHPAAAKAIGKQLGIIDSDDADVIDEYQFLINPVFLGNGKTIFKSGEAKEKRTFLDAKKFECGNSMLRYEASKK